jgi:hypothetical protein
MREKVKAAYMRICEELGQDPEDGLTETEESLIAERDQLVSAWDGHWCGTPALNIEYEYKDRIEALKSK